MNRPLKLSTSIVLRVPAQKRHHTLDNLKWIVRNIRLSDAEQCEVIQAIREKTRHDLLRTISHE